MFKLEFSSNINIKLANGCFAFLVFFFVSSLFAYKIAFASQSINITSISIQVCWCLHTQQWKQSKRCIFVDFMDRMDFSPEFTFNSVCLSFGGDGAEGDDVVGFAFRGLTTWLLIWIAFHLNIVFACIVQHIDFMQICNLKMGFFIPKMM